MEGHSSLDAEFRRISVNFVESSQFTHKFSFLIANPLSGLLLKYRIASVNTPSFGH